MKCPSCATKQQRREGMTCKKCGYVHVFDPKADGITDGKFMGLIKAASSNNTYFFTFNQLYSVYCRGRSRLIAAVIEHKLKPLGVLGRLVIASAIVGGVTGAILLDDPLPIALGIAGLIAGIALVVVGRSRRELEPAHREPPGMTELRDWVKKWDTAGRPIPKLLRAPSLDRSPGPYREGDIFDYGVERVLIVEHDLLVDLMVKNNLHAEHRALVVSERGYPSYLVPHARRLLEERPDLPVVLLHDATPEGTAMATRLRQSAIYPLASRRLTDAGLFPRAVPRIKSLEPTIPGSYDNAARVDFLPFGVMAGGLAGLIGAGVLTSAALAQAAGPPAQHHPAIGTGSSSDSGFIGDAGSSLIDAATDFSDGGHAGEGGAHAGEGGGHAGDASADLSGDGGADFSGDGGADFSGDGDADFG